MPSITEPTDMAGAGRTGVAGPSLRRALVTGATAGIGAAFSRHLAVAGYRLVMVARDEQRLAERRASLLSLGAPEVEVLVADLADPQARDRIKDRLSDTGAPIDLLVNNAGIGLGKEFLQASEEELLAQLELNVISVLLLCHAALPAMVARGHGAVINVASIAGLVSGRGSAYAASKAYVVSLSEGLAVSLAGTGVRIQALCPGFVRTEFHQRAGIDMSATSPRLYVDVDRLVSTSLADLQTNKVVSVPGPLYGTIAVLSRLAPRGLVRQLAGRVHNKGRT